jgi:hypothetical protein
MDRQRRGVPAIRRADRVVPANARDKVSSAPKSGRTFQIQHYANHNSLGFGRFGSGIARTPCILAAICSSFFEIISLAPEFSG